MLTTGIPIPVRKEQGSVGDLHRRLNRRRVASMHHGVLVGENRPISSDPERHASEDGPHEAEFPGETPGA